jgi:hypothetical protein
MCVYEVPGGALNLSSTNLHRPWSPRESSPSKKNPHVRTKNLTWDLMISSQKLWLLDSSQKLWLLDHEAGLRGLNQKYNFFVAVVT